jgi:hypothetical protein
MSGILASETIVSIVVLDGANGYATVLNKK